MGLYDEYVPVPDPSCPKCGSPMRGWQGNDGPRRLVTWKQGEVHPVKAPGDGIDAEEVRALRLPEAFAITGGSCPCSARFGAVCRTDEEGRWISTEVVTRDEIRDFQDPDWRT